MLAFAKLTVETANVSWLNSLLREGKIQETWKILHSEHFPIPGFSVTLICQDDSSILGLHCSKEDPHVGTRWKTGAQTPRPTCHAVAVHQARRRSAAQRHLVISIFTAPPFNQASQFSLCLKTLRCGSAAQEAQVLPVSSQRRVWGIRPQRHCGD